MSRKDHLAKYGERIKTPILPKWRSLCEIGDPVKTWGANHWKRTPKRIIYWTILKGLRELIRVMRESRYMYFLVSCCSKTTNLFSRAMLIFQIQRLRYKRICIIAFPPAWSEHKIISFLTFSPSFAQKNACFLHQRCGINVFVEHSHYGQYGISLQKGLKQK